MLVSWAIVSSLFYSIVTDPFYSLAISIFITCNFLFIYFFLLHILLFNNPDVLNHAFKVYLQKYSKTGLTDKEIDLFVQTSKLLGFMNNNLSLNNVKKRFNVLAFQASKSLLKTDVAHSTVLTEYFHLLNNDKNIPDNHIANVFLTLFAIYLPSDVISKDDKKRIINHSISVNGLALSYIYKNFNKVNSSSFDKDILIKSINSFIKPDVQQQYINSLIY